MQRGIILPVIFAIFILGMFGLPQNAFGDSFTLFPIFVDSFSVTGEDVIPTGLAFSFDGTKMFVVGTDGSDINEYTLSTPFDVSTSLFVDSFSVVAQETNPNGLAFSSDGTKMFVTGIVGDDVNEYTLSTPFDVSTSLFVDSFSIVGQEQLPRGITFSSDGTKMFVTGSDGDAVHEYTLSTPFDVSTSLFVDSFSVATQETIPTGLAFSSDGTKMFVTGSDGDAVHEYTLSAAFDVSTSLFVASFSVAGQDTGPHDLAFSSDGTKMFVVSSAGDDVNEYNLSSSFTLFPTFVDSFSVASEDIAPQGLAFGSDGTKMFVVGNTGDNVYEYTLSTPFDVSTSLFVDSFSVAGEDVIPSGLAFSSDGTKMFVVGVAGDNVYEYTLSTPFDVSTSLFVDSISISGQDTLPLDITFSSDGTKMFVVGDFGDAVYEYTLSTPFDVSTSLFVDSFSVALQDTFLTGLSLSSDGTKMFVVGAAGDAVYEYTLSTPFDVTSASFVNSFSVAGQDTGPTGLAFNSDGTKLFVVGAAGDAVYEYEVPLHVMCSPPVSGDWTVSSTCTMTGDATADGNVIVPNGVVLTIPNGVTLDINFATKNLTVQAGGGVLIKAGGAIT